MYVFKINIIELIPYTNFFLNFRTRTVWIQQVIIQL